MTDYQFLAVDEPRPGVRRVVLDNPPKRNAINEPMRRELERAIEAGEAPVLAFQGADGTFSSGRDRDEIPDDEAAKRDHTGVYVDLLEALSDADRITVAVVEGYAIGGAMAFAAACDLRVMVEGSYLRLPVLEVNPGSDIVRFVARRLREGRVADLVLTGDRLSATEALRDGFAERVVGSVDEGLDLAGRIAEADPSDLRAATANYRRHGRR